jgi:hypothetical protein
MVGTTEGEDIASDLIRTVSRHSLAYMLCAASEMFRHYDFDPLDLMIIHAVLNANVLKIMKNPELPPCPAFSVCRSKPFGGAPIA